MIQPTLLLIPTETAAVLFEHVIKGQLSDGMWENSGPTGHWEFWSQTVPQVDATRPPQTLLQSARPKKCGYRLGALRSVIQEEMIEDVQKRGFPTYDVKQLIADMRAIQKGMRTLVP